MKMFALLFLSKTSTKMKIETNWLVKVDLAKSVVKHGLVLAPSLPPPTALW